jgi:extradiol dioxygenase family protein
LSRPRFHLAFPVRDLEATRRFYVDLLGCGLGRASARWLDFDFFGHQITAHLVSEGGGENANEVDGDAVPVPHFGAILPWEDWQTLAQRLRDGGVAFVIEPRVRFAGRVGEQATMFLRDPSGNALEFKSFRDESRVFATEA